MAEKKNVVTYSGLKKIEEELQNLKVNKRREIAAACGKKIELVDNEQSLPMSQKRKEKYD